MAYHRQNRLIWGIWLWVIGLMLLTTLFITQAQTESDYTGLDILFLVDQSGSMGGEAFGYTLGGDGTDPLSLRFEAVQYALDTLSQYRLTVAPDVPIRMAVINFGDDPDASDIRRGWFEIAPDGATQSWESTRIDLLNTLSADAFRERNTPDFLGNTNFIGAFEAAANMFALLPGENRLQVVVLLTDGSPCVPSQFNCDSLTAQADHMERLQELITEAFPQDTYLLYVLALDDSGRLWERWRGEWQAIVRNPDNAVRVETSQQVGVQFLNILIELVNRIRGIDTTTGITNLNPGRNVIAVPPYLSELRVSIFKSTSSPGVLDVTRPDDSVLRQTDPNLTITNRNRPIEVWTLRNPEPGDWTFVVGDVSDRIDVYLEFIPLDVQAQIVGGTFLQYETVTLQVDLTTADGRPLPIYEAPYDLRVITTLTRPDRTTETRTLERQLGSTFTTNYQVEQVGIYDIGLTAAIASGSATTDDETILYKNAGEAQFVIRGIVFTPGNLPQAIDYLQGDRVTLTATVRDSDEQPLESLTPFVVAEWQRDGNTATLPLEAIGDGQFEATLLLNEIGSYGLRLVAGVRNDAGEETQVGVTSPVLFTVEPSQPVSLRLVEPEQSTITQYTTQGLPPLVSTPLTLVFETVTTGGQAVDLPALAQDPDNLWSVVLLQDTQEQTTPTIQPLPDETGRYQVQVDDLPVGEYTLTIHADGRLTRPYVINALAQSVTINVSRQINPLIYILIGLAIVLVLGVIVTYMLRLRRLSRLRQHAAQGKLVIRDQETALPVWEFNFDGKRRNYHDLRHKRLRRLGITRLIVESPDDRAVNNRRVVITVYKGKDKIHSQRALSPGRPIRLDKPARRAFGDDVAKSDGPRYEIVKDPDYIGI